MEHWRRLTSALAAGIAVVLTATSGTSAGQTPTVLKVDENSLREYAGVYRWGPDAFIYLQLWDEFSGFGKPRELVSLDDTGEVRTLYTVDRDAIFTETDMVV